METLEATPHFLASTVQFRHILTNTDLRKFNFVSQSSHVHNFPILAHAAIEVST